MSTNESDGSDVTNVVLDDRFPSGFFVAMSDDSTFHYCSWDDFAGDDLKKATELARRVLARLGRPQWADHVGSFLDGFASLTSWRLFLVRLSVNLYICHR